jgi:hypothetical protein
MELTEQLKALDEWWATQPRTTTDYRGATHPLQRFGATPLGSQPVPRGRQNPYWEMVQRLPVDTLFGRGNPDGHGLLRIVDAPADLHRQDLVRAYSWAIPSPGDIRWMRKHLHGQSVVEMGAGGGYWAWQLEQAGTDVLAYDVNPYSAEWENPATTRWFTGEQPFHAVYQGEFSEVKYHPGRALLLCWPSYGEPWAAQALACYTGDDLFYIGENAGGCTADDDFFDLLTAEWEYCGSSPAHVTYSGIHCELEHWKRKKGRAK